MGIRVVLIDDHRLLREGLRRSLEDEDDIEVVGEAGDGEAGVRLAERLAPDVVLLDVSMPGMGGVEAARLLTDRVPSARVVMLSMHVDADVVADALRAGAAGYVPKDCSSGEIADAVRRAAGGDTTLSPRLAATVLHELRRLDRPAAAALVTDREAEVLQLIADGCSTPEVAASLYISQKTVKNHLASIYQKLDARDRTQAVIRAVRLGIVKLA